MSKKNTRKKEILNNDPNEEPCVCGHFRFNHFEEGTLCFACFGKKDSRWAHQFTLDNLTYIEKLYNKKQLDKFKRMENNGR